MFTLYVVSFGGCGQHTDYLSIVRALYLNSILILVAVLTFSPQ